MAVLGKNTLIIADTGKTAQVTPFTPDYKSMENVKFVDGAIAYDCLYSGTSYILLIHNALYVPSMTHTLIPPFIMREAGLVVNDTPKIHTQNPTQNHYSIYFKETKLRIPLAFHGVFSYFPTRLPSDQDMSDVVEVLHLTLDILQWNPHSEAYDQDEYNMLDFQGRIIKNEHSARILISDLEDDDAMV